MTLEDFFTLTEMKDGLTAPSRVEELLTVMKREKDSVVKNVSDATRQWTAVTSTIAATDNKDCLDLFIQLDGLYFIDQWLRDALEFSKDTSDSFVEESITALLRALERLHIDNERSISSGIWMTVKNLLGHSSSRVQDKARGLLGSWNQDAVTDAVDIGVEHVGAVLDNEITDNATSTGENSMPECSAVDVSLSKGSCNQETDEAVAAKAGNLPSGSQDGLQPEMSINSQIETSKSELPYHLSSDHTSKEDGSPNHLPSLMSKPVQENSSTEENLPTGAEGTASFETCNYVVSKHESDEVSGLQQKLGVAASTSYSVEHVVSSGAGVAIAEEVTTEAKLQNSADANKNDCLEAPASDVRIAPSELKTEMDDSEVDCSTSLLKMIGQDMENNTDRLQGSCGNNLYGKHEDLDTSVSRIEEIGAADEDKGHSSDGSEILRSTKSSKRSMGSRSPDVNKKRTRSPDVNKKRTRSSDVNKKRTSDIGLEYGLVDPLEVARKVALEVEREVVGCQEPSCSSSEKISEGGIRKPGSPDSINGKQESAPEVQLKEVSTGSDHSAETHSREECSISSDNLGTKPENATHDVESSQVTLAQEPEPNSEKSICDFDLNQEVCSDDMEHPVTSISAATSVVSTSKVAVDPGLPAGPLQFEGALGWKGSASTSAFHPASPHRNSDGDKMLCVGGTSSSSSKHRSDFLDFDLNVSEDGDDKAADLMLGKQITASSGLLSAESSQEPSPRRSERFALDLNRTSEDGDAPPSDSRVDRQFFHNRIGHRSPSPASSSSSMQLSLRNIDLNDRPVIQIDLSDTYHGSSTQNLHTYRGPKPDYPVISIMGTKVEVNKDFSSHVPSLSNGKALDAAVDTNVTRTGSILGLGPTVSFTHSPVFGYNGLTTPPTMPFSSAMYGAGGSIPYMVNSRGAPVVPQIVNSAVHSYSQPPFVMNINGASLSLNGAVSSQPNIDLNSGFAIEGGHRDPMGLRQPFLPVQSSRSIEDHPRVNPQTPSSGVGEKRKEPDSGWESYPFNSRQQFPRN
ncbi:hypothetical protein SLEP1_g4158 [Rubroshorea leprosula]|uniref:TFIIS N-terminal domain-containing protein n=1 Tax=Rubroshorea leprosula TaxID=152421 RepID=A0AAV5HWJ9_9ROSI|nr:hypothetical protein SLEP1_g4158 [Rubroshorea leprosula]